jgi:hypothetical protein
VAVCDVVGAVAGVLERVRAQVTREQRTVVSMALNDAKRAWIQEQGGYRKVEDDAQGHELVLRRLTGEKRQPHGTRACYLRGCRQAPCLEAYRTYNREWKRAHRGAC